MKYEVELLKIFELMNCKLAVTPAETNHKLGSDGDGENVDVIIFKHLVGYLRYLCNTRYGVCYAIGMMSRFKIKPKWSRYHVIVRILMYVKETTRHKILFPSRVLDDADLV